MPDRLQEIRARLDAATPGPWRYEWPWLSIGKRKARTTALLTDRDAGDFIVSARDDVSFLLHAVDFLVAEVARYRIPIMDGAFCDVPPFDDPAWQEGSDD